jgi:hypothetical protein
MSLIQSNAIELKEINLEIKRLREEITKLRKRGNAIEKNIITFLNEKEQKGVKYENTAILIQNKTKNIRKSKKDIEQNTLRILRDNGIHNAEHVLKQMNDSRIDNSTEIQKISVQTIKK